MKMTHKTCPSLCSTPLIKIAVNKWYISEHVFFVSDVNEMWVIVLYFRTEWNSSSSNIRRPLTLSFISKFHAVMKHKMITYISFVSEIHAFVKYKTINYIVQSLVKLVFNHSEYVYFSSPYRGSTIRVFVLLDLIH